MPDLAVRGNAGRVYALEVVKPAALGAVANGWMIDAYGARQNLLFMALHEPVSGALRVYGGSAQPATDASYALDRTRSFDAPLTRSELGTFSDPVAFGFPIFDPEPVVLEPAQLFDVLVESVDGVAIPARGRFLGLLAPQHAVDVLVDPVGRNLSTYLSQSGVALDFDRDHDGEPDSWVVEGVFATEPAWLF
jgi:hypothetical protein